MEHIPVEEEYCDQHFEQKLHINKYIFLKGTLFTVGSRVGNFHTTFSGDRTLAEKTETLFRKKVTFPSSRDTASTPYVG